MKSLPTKIASFAALGLCLSIPGHAQIFNNATNDGLYSTAGNWSGNAVPNLRTATTATIEASATYTGAAGDLTISNGGVLEVTTGGTWTQANTPAYIQLAGGGTVLVDGGTFNQGSATSNPFNISNSNNAFTITSGVANFNNSFNLNVGLSYNQSGGTVNDQNGEFDINNSAGIMTGGVLNTQLLTTQNAGSAGASFQFGGGTINVTSGFGIYGGNSNQLDFTLGSTGVMNFANTSAASVAAMISAGIIQYNNGAGTYALGSGPTTGTDFTILATGANSTELFSGAAAPVSAPEPSTYAMMGAGLLTLLVTLRRRAARQSL